MEFSFDRVLAIIGAIAIPAAIGAGLAMDTKTAGELRFAQVLFCFAAAIAITFTIIWGASAEVGIFARIVITMFLLSISGVGAVESIRWAQRRHEAREPKAETKSPEHIIAPPTSGKTTETPQTALPAAPHPIQIVKPNEPKAPQSAPELKPEITAVFVQGTSPGLILFNKSAITILDPMASYGMWNLSKTPPLMIPTWEVRESGAFIKQNTGRIVATADTPQAKPFISIGDRIFAFIIVDCPQCKSSRIYYLYFVYGKPEDSWVSEAPEGAAGNVLMVNNFMQQAGWDPEKFLTMVPHSPLRRLNPSTGLITPQ